MDAADRVRTGSCLCGKVEVRVQGEPLRNVLCHCLSCQKACGVVFMSNMCCARDSVTVIDPESLVRKYEDPSCDSGSALRRSFCSVCGSHICTTSVGKPPHTTLSPFVSVPMGIMDCDKEDLAPSMEFFVKRRVGWQAGVVGSEEFQEMTYKGSGSDEQGE